MPEHKEDKHWPGVFLNDMHAGGARRYETKSRRQRTKSLLQNSLSPSIPVNCFPVHELQNSNSSLIYSFDLGSFLKTYSTNFSIPNNLGKMNHGSCYDAFSPFESSFIHRYTQTATYTVVGAFVVGNSVILDYPTANVAIF